MVRTSTTSTITNADVEALRTASDTLTDTFTYKMTDAAGLESVTQITVTIEGANDDPIAVDDGLTATEAGGVSNATAGSNGTGNVLTNDTDIDDGDTQTVVGVLAGDQPSASGNVDSSVTGTYGSLTIRANGDATFVVDNDNAAVQALRTSTDQLTETFTYTMQDAAGADSTATVTITIQGQNDAVVGVSDTATAVEASGVSNHIAGTDPTGNVLTNDTDVDAGDAKTVTGVATGTQTTTSGDVGTSVTGSYGTLVINSDGSYTYTVDNDNPTVDGLLEGESLSETFSYTVVDTVGTESTTQIVITIEGRTDLPNANQDVGAAQEDGGVANAATGTDSTGNVLDNDTSNQGKEVIGVAPGTPPAAVGNVGTSVDGTYGSVTIDANGDFVYVIDNTNAVVEALRTSGENVEDVFTYTMEDDFNVTSSTTLTITITGANDFVVAVTDTDTATESGGDANATGGADATGNVVTNDTDVDDGDTKTVVGVASGSVADATTNVGASVTGSYGSIVINNDGTYTYTINETLAAVEQLRTSADTLTDTFTYKVQDTAGGTDVTQITVTIEGTNDKPIAVVDTDTAYEAGGVSNGTAGTDPTGNVLTNDTDVDAGDTKTVVGVAAGTLASASGSVNTSVTGTYGSITINTDGSYTYNVDNDNATVQGLRTSGQSLTDTFTYTFRDTDGLDSTTQITVTVRGANDAIDATADTLTAVEAGGTTNGTAGTNPTTNVLANDTDVDAGDTKNVSGVAAGNVSSASGSVASSVPGLYGTIYIAANGDATYTVDNNNTAVQALLNSSETLTDVFTYSVQDTAGATSTTQVTVTIQGANDAPVAIADTGTADEAGGENNATAGNNATGNVLTNDNQVDEGDTHTVTGVNTDGQIPASANVDAALTGTYGTITVNSDGTYTYVIDENNATVQALRTTSDTVSEVFTYETQDAAGLASTSQITITIRGANDNPVANFDTDTAVEAGGVGNGTAGTNPSGNVLTNDTDIDSSDTRTVTGNVVGVASAAVGNSVAGSYGSITINADGTYSYTVDNNNASVEGLRNSSETLDDVFTYTITDDAGGTSSSQITVTIEGTNDAPVISIVGSDSAAEAISETSTTLTTSGTLTVTDLDTTDEVTSSVTGLVVIWQHHWTGQRQCGAASDADIDPQRVGQHGKHWHPDVEF